MRLLIKFFLIVFFIALFGILVSGRIFNFDKQELKVTLEHPFLVDGSWISASELSVGDEIQTADGKTARVTGLEDIEDNVEVYNLEVEDYSNFVVEDGLVVHNSNAIQRPLLEIPERIKNKVGWTAKLVETNQEREFVSVTVKKQYQRKFLQKFEAAKADPANAGKSVKEIIEKLIDESELGTKSDAGAGMYLSGETAEKMILNGEVDRLIIFTEKCVDAGREPYIVTQGSWKSELAKIYEKHGITVLEVGKWSASGTVPLTDSTTRIPLFTSLDSGAPKAVMIVERPAATGLVLKGHLFYESSPDYIINAYMAESPGTRYLGKIPIELRDGTKVYPVIETLEGEIMGVTVKTRIESFLIQTKAGYESLAWEAIEFGRMVSHK